MCSLWLDFELTCVPPPSMNVSVAALMKKAKKEASPENHSFQQLLMLVGIHLFKVRLHCLLRLIDCGRGGDIA